MEVFQKGPQPPDPDHPGYTWTKKSLLILKTLTCSTANT